MRHTHAYANNSDEGHWASARGVRVVQLFSMADSRTERVRCTIQLPASNIRRCIARTYLIQPSVMSAGFLNALKYSCTQRVAVASDRRNTVALFPGNFS